jgi:hypothetical protein
MIKRFKSKKLKKLFEAEFVWPEFTLVEKG